MWYPRDRMVPRWTMLSTLLLGSVSLATRASAQSLSIEEAPPPPAPTSTPAPATASPPPRPVIVMPEALETPLEYPSGAHGEASVALELTLTQKGDVARAVALEGDEPFASAAVEAAQRWRFRPATRGDEPVAAKIRFLVRFVPPREAPGEQAPKAPSAAPAAPSKPLEIVVIGERPPIRHELARAEISRMPGAFGDAFRAIEALPGVVPIVSGLPYFYVRGAPPGNVGYFFDGIPVPFLYHFAAGPSVFHPAFIDRVDLYPGAYPVRYGRFAGAVVAGEMAPPGYRTRGEWNVRLIDSGAMLEAPFAGGRGSAMVGGRFSYTGLVLSLVVPDVSVGYWDYQARVRYDLGPKDSVEIFGFGSGDYTTYKERTRQLENGVSTESVRERTAVDINFHRLDLRWDRRVEQGNWRNALFLGRDRTGVADGQVNVYDYLVGARSEYWKQLAPDKRLRAGGDLLFESLKQELTDDSGTGEREPEPDAERFGFSSRRDFTLGAYADVVWRVSPRVQITPGLRADVFASGKRAAVGVDPRITAEFQLTPKLKATHGLALVHQAPSFIGPVPGLKSSLAGGLQRAAQHSVTLSYDLPAGFQSSFAVFHSAFFNMTDVISVAQLASTESANDDDFDAFRTGGHAYGLELMVRRSLSRRLGGFVTYTLSRSRRFTGRLSGPATTDRTHVLNVAASYDLGKNWRLGGRVLFYTGIPAQVAYLEAARHPPRTPPFWRLDFKLEKRWYLQKPNRWWGLTLEVLNTTLNKEQLTGNCNAYDCKFQELGPVTVPSIACEGAF